MKRILLILTLLSTLTASAQFPSRDSLQRYINRWVRNSAVESFTNLRLNTAMNGLLTEINKVGFVNSGIQSMAVVGDSLKITTTANDVFSVYLPQAGATNLGVSRTASDVSIQSSTGTSAIIPPATQLFAGSLSAADKIKLDSAVFLAQLRDSINTRIRLIYRRADSVFVNRGLGEQFAYKDSAGGPGTGSVTNVATGYGLSGGPITTTGSIIVDSATLAAKFLRRADSSLYTTRSRHATDLATKLSNITGLITPGAGISIGGSGTAGSPYVISSSASGGTVTQVNSGYGLLGGPITNSGTLRVDTALLRGLYGGGSGGGSQNIDQVLTQGNTTAQRIEYTGAGTETFKYTPNNAGTVYSGYGRASTFHGGWNRFDGVNASGRPNIVATILGYNHTLGGGRIVTDEAGFGFRAETDFQLAGVPSFEFHLPEITTQSGTSMRLFSMYTRKTTGFTDYNFEGLGNWVSINTSRLPLFSYGQSGDYIMKGYGSGSYWQLYRDSVNYYKVSVESDGSVTHAALGENAFDQSLSVTKASEPSLRLYNTIGNRGWTGLVDNSAGDLLFKRSLDNAIVARLSMIGDFQVGAAVVGSPFAGQTIFGTNLRYDGGWKYLDNGAGVLHYSDGTDYFIFNAPSGTAGSAATITSRFKIAGNGAIQTPQYTSGYLQVDGSGNWSVGAGGGGSNWTTSGGNIYRSSLVGIGGAPTYNLDVNGTGTTITSATRNTGSGSARSYVTTTGGSLELGVSGAGASEVAGSADLSLRANTGSALYLSTFGTGSPALVVTNQNLTAPSLGGGGNRAVMSDNNGLMVKSDVAYQTYTSTSTNNTAADMTGLMTVSDREAGILELTVTASNGTAKYVHKAVVGFLGVGNTITFDPDVTDILPATTTGALAGASWDLAYDANGDLKITRTGVTGQTMTWRVEVKKNSVIAP